MASSFGVTIGFQVKPSEADMDCREVVVEFQGLLQVVFGLLMFAPRLQGQRQLDVGFGSSRIS